MSELVKFYSGAAPDDRGRFLSEIQGWPDHRLEQVHDFIQWLFPLREPSGANPDAPALDDADIREFRSSPELQSNLRASYLRMLSFYSAPAKHWLTPGNHNHLRITRMIKSMRLLGL